MGSLNQVRPSVFVIAAQIASHLNLATKTAQQLSLTAKNARAITTRAGQQALGFNAIATFIQELASETIRLAQEINRKALQISMQATELERVQQARFKLNKVILLAEQARYVDSVSGFSKRNARQLKVLNQEFYTLQMELTGLIEQIEKQVRSATVIASMSKIEASKSGSFQQQLEVIGGNIHASADAIKNQLLHSKRLLNQMRGIDENDSHCSVK